MTNCRKSGLKRPLISIITVVYNGEKYLEECIRSVLGQTYSPVEYIVIDGGSTDASVDIIKRYEDSIDQWVSEPDDGVYDAMNKGIRIAKGDVIGLVNADDYYNKDTASIVANSYLNRPNTIITGAMNRIMPDGSSYTIRRNLSQNYLRRNIKYRMPVNHPATFVPKSVYKNIGIFDTSFRISGDYEFICRAFTSGVSFTFVDQVLSNMRSGGMSSGAKNLVQRAKEHYVLRSKNNMFMPIKNAFYSLFWTIITLLKSSVKSKIKNEHKKIIYEIIN